jgi:hypothetical protein
MALINANSLGLYMFGSVTQTTPIGVEEDAAQATAETNAEANFDDGDYVLLANGTTYQLHEKSNKPCIGKIGTGANSGSWIDATGDLKLLGSATSTAIEYNNSIDEVVAKSSLCGSETFTIGTSSSWSFSADGLINPDLEHEVGRESNYANYEAIKLTDLALEGCYVICRFVTDVDSKDGTLTNDSTINLIGQGIIESASVSGGFDEFATYSVTVRGYGKLYSYKNS